MCVVEDVSCGVSYYFAVTSSIFENVFQDTVPIGRLIFNRVVFEPMLEHPVYASGLSHLDRVGLTIGTKSWLEGRIIRSMGSIADVGLYRNEHTEVLPSNHFIKRLIREALVPKVKECTLNAVMHPWSIRFDILNEFLEC